MPAAVSVTAFSRRVCSALVVEQGAHPADEVPQHGRLVGQVSPLSRLGGVSVLSIMTTPDKAYRWWYRDPLTKIMFKGTFGKTGVKNLRWTNYDSITEKSAGQWKQLLRQTEQRLPGCAGGRG